MNLRAVYFMPGVNVVSGVTLYPSSISFWSIDKFPLLKCDEQKNGDIWLTAPDGRRSEISALVIAYRVRVPDAVAKVEAKQQAAVKS